MPPPPPSPSPPPSCFGFSISKWLDKYHRSFFLRSGLQLRLLDVDPLTTIAIWSDPSPSPKPPLVLLHGFGTCAVWQWFPQVIPLQQHFRLFVPDLIFFGKSFTSSHHRSEVFQAQMIANALDVMGISTYSVAGTSYGGFVAFRMAHLFPERVQKVVIANSGVTMTPKDTEGLLLRANVSEVSELMLPRESATLKRLMTLSIAKSQFIPSFILNDLIQYFYIEHRKERTELLHGILLGTPDSEPLPTLTQKTLIIWGEHDGIFLPPMAHSLQQHLQKNAELVIVKRAAHCVQTENPDEFNSHLRRFLLD